MRIRAAEALGSLYCTVRGSRVCGTAGHDLFSRHPAEQKYRKEEKMSKNNTFRRWIAVILVIALLPVFPLQTASANETLEHLGFNRSDYTPNNRLENSFASGEDDTAAPFEDNDVVRVSIVLDEKSTIDAGFDVATIATNKKAVAYRADLQKKQESVAALIGREALGGKKLDVVWNLTLAANIISANVKFGQIEDIKEVSGVKNVFIEAQYEPAVAETDLPLDPNMATSGAQIGSSIAWDAGYTGAGRKIAIIDTGIDPTHQSFDAGAFEHSLEVQGLNVDLMDAADIAAVLSQLNVYKRDGVTDASDLYRSSKIPFAYNYIDENFTIDHLNDSASEHGSHVAGIASANAYVPNGNGGYDPALEAVHVQGVAPDAQLIVMKVFGAMGGAYDSDYFAAVEDAIILGCDSANLSLGTAAAGWGTSTTYSAILDSLTESGLVMVTSAGNNGSWADNTRPGLGYLYGDDIDYSTAGNPGTFNNTLGVASVDNDGFTDLYLQVGDAKFTYADTSSSGYKNAPFTTIAGEHEYIFINDIGTPEQFAEIADVLEGKIALCYRGDISFYLKAEAAVENGALAVIIVNNQAGVINMDLTDYSYTNPAISITMANGEYFKTNWVATDGEELDGYWTGTMTVSKDIGSAVYGSSIYTMSSFSGWGVPQTLMIKPEITAPGGNIYSVNGTHAGEANNPGGPDQYENMSGTSMAAPQITGMVALVDQYLEDMGYVGDNLSRRALAMSLLMSTAVPMEEDFGGDTNSAGYSSYYYPVIRQGAGLANVGNAIRAMSYILMNSDATVSYADGKVKAELGDSKTGKYSYSFTINNLNGQENTYTLSTDLFTQDIFSYAGDLYLDKWTTPIEATVVYTVDGVEFTPKSAVEADVNRDGVTDAADANALLAYIVGNIGEDELDLSVADLDGDGKYTTYDAHLILANMETEAFTVPANGSVNVTVDIKVTEDLSVFENGAYVEGYTFVNPVGDEEGALDVTHSIPLLGFYGSWSDPSMYETGSLAEQLYGTANYPYVATNAYYNYLIYKDNQVGQNYYSIGNPYGIEDVFPADKAAIRSTDSISQIGFTLIRNAATIGLIITDAETDEVLYAVNPVSYTNNNYAAFVTSAGTWSNTGLTMNVSQQLSKLGVKEGQTVKVSVVAVPEYYLTDDILAATDSDPAFNVTLDELLSILPELGEGAFLTTTLKIDDTAPVLIDVSKNLINGDIAVTASDNEDIAYIGILTASGARVYDDVIAPEASSDGTVTYNFKAGELGIGSKCMVLVADYAGNETAYVVEYGGEDPDYTGTMFAYIHNANGQFDVYTTPELNKTWATIDPETVSFDPDLGTYTGIAPFANVREGLVNAAVCVDNYVFYVTEDNILYVSDILELGVSTTVADLAMYGVEAPIMDITFNGKDGMLYAVDDDSDNALWVINPLTGRTEFVDYIDEDNIRSIAVSSDGTFYGTSGWYLSTWTVEDGSVTSSDTIGRLRGSDGSAYEYGGSLFFGNDGTLYLGSSYWGDSDPGDPAEENTLWIVDPDSGAVRFANEYGACLYFDPSAMFIVPPVGGNVDFSDTDEVADIILSATSVDLLEGGSVALSYMITPWTLRDKTVTWTSSDENVAVVNKNGTVTAVGLGEATITATANADGVTSAVCEITVSEIPSINLSALIYDTDSETYWSDYNANNTLGWTKITGTPANSYLAGTLVEDKIYVHDGNVLYAVDADTLETEALGVIDFPYSDAAALPASTEYGNYFAYPYGSWVVLGLPYDLATHNSGIGWNLTNDLGDDSIAVMAYVETSTYSNATSGIADYVYMLTEKGELWIFAFYDGNFMARGYVGHVEGVKLEGVSDVDGSTSASMVYDEETGYLVLTSYIDGVDDGAKMQLIDTDQMRVVASTSFGNDVWPVVANYQYDRATELTVRLSKTAISMYRGSDVTVTATVKLFTENSNVTWSTSDDSVATVVDGVITGVGEGTAVITATSVETKADGTHASASLTVEVKAKTDLDTDATLDAQLADGTWVRIPLANADEAVEIGSSNAFVAGGTHNGTVYGTDGGYTSFVGYLYMLDSTNNYKETFRTVMTYYYLPVDLTTAPAMEIEGLTDGEHTFTGTAFGDPMYIPYDSYAWDSFFYSGRGMFLIRDVSIGRVTGTFNLSEIDNAAALAFGGVVSTEELYGKVGTGEYEKSEIFYVINASSLYMVGWTPVVKGDNAIDYNIRTIKLGDLNRTFADDLALSMEMVDLDGDGHGDGLVVAYAGDRTADMFYIDLSNDDDVYEVEYFGTVPNATGISCLSASEGEILEAPLSVKAADSAMAVKTESVNVSDAPEAVKTEDKNEAEALRAVPYSAPKAAQSKGSLNSISVAGTEAADAPESSVVIDKENKTVTVKVKAEATTNGLYTVEYDKDVLTLESVDGKTVGFAENSKTAGTVKIAFAEGNSFDGTSAELVFTYEDSDEGISTKITLTVYEDGEDVDAEPAAEEIPVEIEPKTSDTDPEGPGTDTGSEGGDTPKTGDNNSVYMWIVALAVSASGFAIAYGSITENKKRVRR